MKKWYGVKMVYVSAANWENDKLEAEVAEIRKSENQPENEHWVTKTENGYLEWVDSLEEAEKMVKATIETGGKWFVLPED